MLSPESDIGYNLGFKEEREWKFTIPDWGWRGGLDFNFGLDCAILRDKIE